MESYISGADKLKEIAKSWRLAVAHEVSSDQSD
jgi:hypothetical protein